MVWMIGPSRGNLRVTLSVDAVIPAHFPPVFHLVIKSALSNPRGFPRDRSAIATKEYACRTSEDPLPRGHDCQLSLNFYEFSFLLARCARNCAKREKKLLFSHTWCSVRLNFPALSRWRRFGRFVKKMIVLVAVPSDNRHRESERERTKLKASKPSR